MSFSIPAYRVRRWSVVGMEGMFAKMFDPPTASPPTPDRVLPTNPVPEVMAQAGLRVIPAVPHTTRLVLMHGLTVPTWDGRKNLAFFVFRDPDVNTGADPDIWPGPTVRVPRGAIFHCDTAGQGPPPHTIHWHGIEPTPMNDGVGHCSMEIGKYTYQWQPNFIGTYFYHCHRNTMQHFEFGLYGMLLILPPDAYFASQWDITIPIGCGRDRRHRTAANLTNFPDRFPDFLGGDIREPDPEAGNLDLPDTLKFATNPHAMTVAYDVEALWVPDDRDSVWSDLASNPHATYPKQGNIPGVNDEFRRNPGANGFFAFNDYNADYWFITGVPVKAVHGGTAAIPENIVIPAEFNSGVSGSQVSINAKVNQTILVRCLNAAYNSLEISFPVNVVIIAWDGRALGGGPLAFNHAYEIPAGETFRISTARRFDALIRSDVPIDNFATIKFINSRGEGIDGFDEVLCIAQIPIKILAV